MVTIAPCSVQSACNVYVKSLYHGAEKQVTAKVSH